MFLNKFKIRLHRVMGGVVLIFLVFSFAIASGSQPIITRKKALLIAEATKEAKLFYELKDGYFVNCIEKSVRKPCDTDWVTCIDNAWVVEFVLGETCGIKHDGRLSLRLLIDAQTGKVISRFPETPYFEDKQYCLENYDCFLVLGRDEQQASCQNFIFGQLLDVGEESQECLCQQNLCVKTPVKK